MAYFNIKHECLYCAAKFSVFTDSPEDVDINTVFCPLCGVTDGAFIAYQEVLGGDVGDAIPGLTLISAIGENIVDEASEESVLQFLTLNQEFREKIARRKKGETSDNPKITIVTSPSR